MVRCAGGATANCYAAAVHDVLRGVGHGRRPPAHHRALDPTKKLAGEIIPSAHIDLTRDPA
jgi:hypothetical protein